MSSVALSKPLTKKKKPKERVNYSLKRNLTKNRLFLLKWLGLILVIGDNITYAFYEQANKTAMTVCGTLGCLCFPLFAYYLVEHFHYYNNRENKDEIKRMFKLLCIIGLGSEIPFNLMKGGAFIYPKCQNVFLTLAVTYFILIFLNKDLSGIAKKLCFNPEKATPKKIRSNERLIKFDVFTLMMFLTAIGNFDYGGEGIVLAVFFDIARKKKHMRVIQFLSFIGYMFARFNLYYAILLVDFVIILFFESKIETEKTEDTKKIARAKSMKAISSIFYFLQIAALLIIKLFMTANTIGQNF